MIIKFLLLIRVVRKPFQTRTSLRAVLDSNQRVDFSKRFCRPSQSFTLATAHKLFTIFIFQNLRLINSLSSVCLPYLSKGCVPLELAGFSEQLNFIMDLNTICVSNFCFKLRIVFVGLVRFELTRIIFSVRF